MKKIAIVTNQMIAGGIEKALIDLLKVIPKQDYNITLYLMNLTGDFFDKIPEDINIKLIPDYNLSLYQHMKKSILNKDVNLFFKCIKYKYKYMKNSDYVTQCELLCDLLPKIDEVYDLVISYSTPVSFPLVYCVKNILAKKKVTWVHNEVDKITVDINTAKNIYSIYDKIFCVSSIAKEKFLKFFPYLNDKTEVFFNIINESEIIRLAEECEGFNDQFDGYRILTVGRLCEEKGQDIIPSIINRLRKDNINFRWYCIGDGEYKRKIKKLIEINGIDNDLLLLGTKKNPYRFFKECDIYVQTSRQDGYGITIAEAKCFNKAIISTNFAGIFDQIIDNKTGYITNFDGDEIYSKIKYLVQNPKQKNFFELNLIKEKKDNRKEITKLLSVIES